MAQQAVAIGQESCYKSWHVDQSKWSFIRNLSSTLLADVVEAGVGEQEAESGRPCTVN